MASGLVIPFCRPSIDEDDCAAVRDAMLSGWIGAGPATRSFEAAFAAATGIPHCVAMNSGTSALYVAMHLLGKPGARVAVPSFTFPATINAVINAGLVPVIVDVDYTSMNVGPEEICTALSEGISGVVVVHFAGYPCDMKPIVELAREHGLFLVEDCAHAIGTFYEGRHAGSWGMGCYSFFATKNISTGEGGMLGCHDRALAEKARLMISHGIPSARQESGVPQREAVLAGHNLRMSGVLAALGESQVRRMRAMQERRETLAQRYEVGLKGLSGMAVPLRPDQGVHGWHMYVVKLASRSLRESLFRELRARGIEVSAHYVPALHRQRIYEQYRRRSEPYAASERLQESVLSLPLFPGLSDSEQNAIIEAIRESLGRAG